MPKMPGAAKLSKAQVKAAISTAKDAVSLESLRAQLSQRSPLWTSRRELRKRLPPLFSANRLDFPRIETALKKHQNEVRGRLDKRKSAMGKAFATLARGHKRAVENRRKALAHIAGLPHIVTPIVIDPPFSIYTIPSGMEKESDIIPHVSYAKIKHVDGKDTSEDKVVSTRFLFAWQNDSGYVAVINANADIVYRGIIQAMSDPGFILGGSASLYLYARLSVHIGGQTLYGIDQLIDKVDTDTRGALLGGTVGGDIDQRYVYDTTNLSYPEFIVEENELVVFAVVFWAKYSIDDGSVMLDFASSQDYFVACNQLIVGLLSRPGMVTGSPGADEGVFA